MTSSSVGSYVHRAHYILCTLRESRPCLAHDENIFGIVLSRGQTSSSYFCGPGCGQGQLRSCLASLLLLGMIIGFLSRGQANL